VGAFRCVVLFLFVAVSGEPGGGLGNFMIYIVRLDVEKKCRCRSWSGIRGRNLVLGGLHCGKLLCFFGDSFGGDWTVGLGIGDWGLGIECHVQGPIWVFGFCGFWGFGWLFGRGWGVGWGGLGGLSSVCAGGEEVL